MANVSYNYSVHLTAEDFSTNICANTLRLFVFKSPAANRVTPVKALPEPTERCARPLLGRRWNSGHVSERHVRVAQE